MAHNSAPTASPLGTVRALEAGHSEVKIQKVRYTHDAMIDIILANPSIKQRELAEMFGYTEAWVSTVICSDSFQARLSVRRTDTVGNSILMNFNERMRRMAFKSLKRVEDELEKNMACDVDVALDALKVAAKGFGFGNGPQVQVNQQNNTTQYVVQMPGKATSAKAWAEAYGATDGGMLAETASSVAVPPLPPTLEALCVESAMDAEPDLIPIGGQPDAERG